MYGHLKEVTTSQSFFYFKECYSVYYLGSSTYSPNEYSQGDGDWIRVRDRIHYEVALPEEFL